MDRESGDGRGIYETSISFDSEIQKTGDVDSDATPRECDQTVNSVEALNGGTSAYSTCLDERRHLKQGTVNSVGSVEEGTGDFLSSSSSETIIVIGLEEDEAVSVTGENEDSNAKLSVVELKKAVDEVKVEELNDAKHSRVLDVKCGGKEFGVSLDDDWVCRICHLNSDQLSESSSVCRNAHARGLILLGCGCKDELGTAHSHCAETWFKLKGNRSCEICGETAQNVAGVVDDRFMEDWNDRRSSATSLNSREVNMRCWRGQTFCNFLMACLVIAFVLPWFFRINMF